MDYCMCNRLPPAFLSILSNEKYDDFSIDHYDLSDLNETYQLCQSIIITIDNAMLNKENLIDAFQRVIDRHKDIEGFKVCKFAINIKEYFSHIQTEKDNDYLKGESLKAVQNDLFKIRNFMREMEIKNGTIQM